MSNLQVVIPLFPKFTALDGIGPYEVLQRIPSIDVTFIGHKRGEVRSENGFLGITADATFDDFPRPDVLLFPGGVGTRPLVHDEQVVEWVRSVHRTTTFTTSVCTGSLVLGAAGILNGLTATTHWACYPELEVHGAIPTAQRLTNRVGSRGALPAGRCTLARREGSPATRHDHRLDDSGHARRRPDPPRCVGGQGATRSSTQRPH